MNGSELIIHCLVSRESDAAGHLHCRIWMTLTLASGLTGARTRSCSWIALNCGAAVFGLLIYWPWRWPRRLVLWFACPFLHAQTRKLSLMSGEGWLFLSRDANKPSICSGLLPSHYCFVYLFQAYALLIINVRVEPWTNMKLWSLQLVFQRCIPRKTRALEISKKRKKPTVRKQKKIYQELITMGVSLLRLL